MPILSFTANLASVYSRATRPYFAIHAAFAAISFRFASHPGAIRQTAIRPSNDILNSDALEINSFLQHLN
jgi:hypothetical protein